MRRECTRCLMDNSASDISFDDRGHCNYCQEFLEDIRDPSAEDKLDQFIDTVRRRGKNKPYDCIVGLSGGVDSSYTLHLTKQLGLRPLAVHLDNGWNSEIAVRNIASLVRSLEVDLYTHVIEWRENKDLQRSFFQSDVVDIEMLMDNAMQATNYQQARKYGLRYILSGSNHATEGLRMPPDWTHCKLDAKNIRAIHKRFGSVKIRTHPLISTKQFAWNRAVLGIKWISFLDFFNYRKQEAVSLLQKEHGYQPYPYKHYESVFTRFYQGHILPRKFGIDKRRIHLSTLVLTGQMERGEAVQKLNESPYPEPNLLKRDHEFVLKKLGFSEKEFVNYLQAPPVPHAAYPSEERLFRFLVRIGKRWGVSR